MPGGVREIYMSVEADALAQPTMITVDGQGDLVVSSGLKSYWGAYLLYGWDLDGLPAPLDLDLSGYDSIRLDFGSNDAVTVGGVQLWNDGAGATADWYAEPSYTPFSVDVPFTALDTPLSLDSVDQIVVLLQTGAPNAGNDLQLSSISIR